MYNFNNNSYQGRSNGYNRAGNYNRAPYNPQYNNAPQYRNGAPPRKKSGAKETMGKNGKPAISAWKKTRNAFLTLIACPNNEANVMRKDGSAIINKKGQEYARWTATLVDRNTGSMSTHSCLYNTVTRKLYIPDLKMVANAHAANGGYFGNSYMSKRR